MALTRKKDDDSYINKQLDLMTFQGRYMLGEPGPGNVPFQEDVFIRLQKNGANMRTNSLNIENSLLGLNKPLTKDCILYTADNPISYNVQVGNQLPYTEQSRAIMPAWTARNLEQNNFDVLLHDPQRHSMINFEHNNSSRIEEINKYNQRCVS
uniref:Uncharacterized protein n=1 Tax=Megaviridae environmental sample TaxID=1737588 RepID=A0A5J6VM93_9VIRU|nr:MAG: hypothetical protein [Megaviridae environmental sample]